MMHTKNDINSTVRAPERQVLGVSGSPRSGGNSEKLLALMLEEVAACDILAKQVLLRQYTFSSCIGCERCRKNRGCTGLFDGMQLIYPQLIASQGLILISPTHNYNVTAWMKAFIDRLYCLFVFEDTRPRAWTSRLAQQGRKAVIVAICEQEDRHDMGWTLEAMRYPLEALGFDIVGELPVLGIFDKGGVMARDETLLHARQLARTLAQALCCP